MTLAEWLRRSSRSQEWFAAQIDGTCTQALVSKWARGVTLPSAERMDRIRVVTGANVTARGLVLRHKRMKAKIKARGEVFRAMRGIE